MSSNILLFSSEGISRQRSGTAGSELMKSSSPWLIIYLKRVSTPPAMTRKPGWQVPHSQRDWEAFPCPCRPLTPQMAQAPHGTFQLSPQHYKREIHNSESKQGLSDPQLHILLMALSNVFFPTYSLLGRYQYLRNLSSWTTACPLQRGMENTIFRWKYHVQPCSAWGQWNYTTFIWKL